MRSVDVRTVIGVSAGNLSAAVPPMLPRTEEGVRVHPRKKGRLRINASSTSQLSARSQRQAGFDKASVRRPAPRVSESVS